MIGRDCHSTATNVGAWCGGFNSESGLPRDWVDTVCRVNLRELAIRGLGEALLTVRVT